MNIQTLLLATILLLTSCQHENPQSKNDEFLSFFLYSSKSDYKNAYKHVAALVKNKKDVPYMLKQKAIITLAKAGDTLSLTNYIGQQSNDTKTRLCNEESINELKLNFCNDLEYIEDVQFTEYRSKLVRCYIRDQYSRQNPLIKYADKYGLTSDTIGYTVSEGKTDSINRNIVHASIGTWGLPTRGKVGIDGMEAFATIVLHANDAPVWQREMLRYIESILPTHQFLKNFYAHIYDRVQIFQLNKNQKYGSHIDSLDSENKKLILFKVENQDSLATWRKEMDLLPLALYEALMFSWE